MNMLIALIKKEILALLRDVNGLAALFVMPLLFIIVMSMALKDVYNPPAQSLNYAIKNHDTSDLSSELIKAWEKEHGAAQTLPSDWRSAVLQGKINYVLQIQADFGAQLKKDKLAQQTQLTIFAEPRMELSQFKTLGTSLLLMTNEMRAQTVLKTQSAMRGQTSPSVEFSTQALIHSERLSAQAQPTSVQQNVPAWLIFGMFFVITAIASLFIQERETGTLNRLLSIGVSPRVLLTAKAITYLGVNALQAILMLAVGIWLMPKIGGEGLSLTGVHIGSMLLMLFCISWAAVGLALLLASLLRTHAQAATVGPIVNVLMAAVGGIMVPTFVMPEVMQKLAHASPMGWALQGLLDIIVRGADWRSVTQPMISLLSFGSVMLLLAYIAFKKRWG